jgi:hypothetical protein
MGTAIAVPQAESIQGTIAYALKGNKTTQFWGYNIAQDSWFSRADIINTTKKPVNTGGTLVAADNGKLYATKGKCLEFLSYNPQSASWTQLPNVPGIKKLGPGSSATAVLKDSIAYVYLLKGYGTTEFYRFNTSSNTWDSTSLAQPPKGTENKTFKKGSCIAYDGNDTIYAVKGWCNTLYAYSVGSDTWLPRSNLPFYGRSGRKVRAGNGAAMAFYGDRLYLMKGSNSQEMWVYDRTASTPGWLQADDVPTAPSGKMVRDGGCMAAAHGFLWALKGNKQPDFYRFMPTQRLEAPPSQPSAPAPGSNELCLAENGDAEDVRWSNSGEWVAYTAMDQDGRRQVFKVSSDSGEPVQLTSLNGECSRPVWSPGDTSIAFEVTPDSTGHSQIAVVPSDSGAVTYLTTSSYDHWHATWSPGAHVYVKLSTGETPMTQASVEHESPEFASATVMTFAREGLNGYMQVYRTTVNSQSETPITSSSADHANPVPVPNGGKVFYEVDDAYGYTQVAKVPLQGGAELVLTSGSYDFESPTVNGDGGLIFCTKSDGPGSSICQVNSTGGYVELTDDEVERVVPHAQPNGTTSIAAAYVRDGDVFRLTAGGDGQQTAGLFPFALEGAKPNPGRARIVIRWQVPAEARAFLRVYNTAGQLVRVLADGRVKPGAYTSVWNGTDARGRRLANGVYFYALDNGSKRISRKLVLTD